MFRGVPFLVLVLCALVLHTRAPQSFGWDHAVEEDDAEASSSTTDSAETKEDSTDYFKTLFADEYKDKSKAGEKEALQGLLGNGKSRATEADIRDAKSSLEKKKIDLLSVDAKGNKKAIEKLSAAIQVAEKKLKDYEQVKELVREKVAKAFETPSKAGQVLQELLTAKLPNDYATAAKGASSLGEQKQSTGPTPASKPSTASVAPTKPSAGPNTVPSSSPKPASTISPLPNISPRPTPAQTLKSDTSSTSNLGVPSTGFASTHASAAASGTVESPPTSSSAAESSAASTDSNSVSPATSALPKLNSVANRKSSQTIPVLPEGLLTGKTSKPDPTVNNGTGPVLISANYPAGESAPASEAVSARPSTSPGETPSQKATQPSRTAENYWQSRRDSGSGYNAPADYQTNSTGTFAATETNYKGNSDEPASPSSNEPNRNEQSQGRIPASIPTYASSESADAAASAVDYALSLLMPEEQETKKTPAKFITEGVSMSLSQAFSAAFPKEPIVNLNNPENIYAPKGLLRELADKAARQKEPKPAATVYSPPKDIFSQFFL